MGSGITACEALPRNAGSTLAAIPDSELYLGMMGFPKGASKARHGVDCAEDRVTEKRCRVPSVKDIYIYHYLLEFGMGKLELFHGHDDDGHDGGDSGDSGDDDGSRLLARNPSRHP